MPYFEENGQWKYKSKNGVVNCGLVKCFVCNKEHPKLNIYVKKSKRNYCSYSCRSEDYKVNQLGENNKSWKGGKHTDKKGYVLLYKPDHPHHVNDYVLEHRLIMEKKIGRYLTKEETVHHKNGIKSDNRIENLELWSSRHPKGQRVEDLVEWAKEILKLYGENVNNE